MKMNSIGARVLAICVLLVFLVAGVLLSFITPSHSAIAIIHYCLAAVFVTLITWGTVHHVAKFKTDPKSRIAWIHISIFSFLLMVAAWAVGYHARMAVGGHGFHQEHRNQLKLFTRDGRCKDATEFAKQHPGGAAIWRGNGKVIEDHWEKSGKSFHFRNGARRWLDSLPDCVSE